MRDALGRLSAISPALGQFATKSAIQAMPRHINSAQASQRCLNGLLRPAHPGIRSISSRPAVRAPPAQIYSISPQRKYATHAQNAKLNVPIDYGSTPLLAHSSKTALSNPELPQDVRDSTCKRMNMYQAINDAMRTALTEDETVIVFGEDIAFGGVFRCTMNLEADYGSYRVFNTPLSEQGIVGFGIGAAAEGLKPIAEIQFADYVFPAFDQIVNEAAKFRYREGATGFNCGGLVIRMPSGGVGHGALYHSQSPESLFTHVPGMRVVMPRSPIQAKGLLLASIASKDPVIFMEPKILYRAAVEEVPTKSFQLPLSKAEILREGKDVTVISWGTPLYTSMPAINKAEQDFGIKVELIDLRTIYPWDRPTIIESVNKTGRAVVIHEAMVNSGFGAEIAATIQDSCFLRLEAPVQRVAGPSSHHGLVYEKFFVPDGVRIYDAIRKAIKF